MAGLGPAVDRAWADTNVPYEASRARRRDSFDSTDRESDTGTESKPGVLSGTRDFVSRHMPRKRTLLALGGTAIVAGLGGFAIGGYTGGAVQQKVEQMGGSTYGQPFNLTGNAYGGYGGL